MNYKFIILFISLCGTFIYAFNNIKQEKQNTNTIDDIPSTTLYITSTKGNGDYKCNGIQDQIVINEALDRVASDSNLTTVYLKGSMTCIIDEPILISNNTNLIGDSTVTVKLKDNRRWNTPNKPLIGQKNSDGSVAWKIGKYGKGSISNVEIAGFELSGGIQSERTGRYFVMLISLYDSSYIKIHNMNLHDSRGDIIRFYGSSVGKINHVEVYNNKIKNSGHEGIYFIYPNLIKAYNNEIYNTRTNSGIRVSTGSNFSIYNNTIGNNLANSSSGYAGILIGSSNNTPIGKANIYNNYIYGKNGGIVLSANKGFNSKNSLKDVHIHHNRLYKINNFSNDSYLNGAIRINGFYNTLIEYNTIEGSKKDGIVYEEYDGVKGRGTGYQTIVRNNIISNCKGYGINNLNSNIHSFISENNNLFNNGVKNGNIHNYNNVLSSSDIHVDPLYAHAKSKADWIYLVATYDSLTERFKIYVNGQEKANQQFLGFGNIGINNSNISLGTYRGLDYFQLNGKLDDMAVWKRALTNNEVLALWNSGNGKNINGNSLTNKLKAYWKMENNWNDSVGTYHSQVGWSSATFSTEAKLDNYAGVFQGENNYTLFPNNLSPSTALTIATWIYRDETSLKSDNIQTIFNKGSQDNNAHIWLYAKGNNFYFELGNGNGIRRSVSAYEGVDPLSNLDLHLQSKYGRWNGKKWVLDSETSLAIGLGAYGNTFESSKK